MLREQSIEHCFRALISDGKADQALVGHGGVTGTSSYYLPNSCCNLLRLNCFVGFEDSFYDIHSQQKLRTLINCQIILRRYSRPRAECGHKEPDLLLYND